MLYTDSRYPIAFTVAIWLAWRLLVLAQEVMLQCAAAGAALQAAVLQPMDAMLAPGRLELKTEEGVRLPLLVVVQAPATCGGSRCLLSGPQQALHGGRG